MESRFEAPSGGMVRKGCTGHGTCKCVEISTVPDNIYMVSLLRECAQIKQMHTKCLQASDRESQNVYLKQFNWYKLYVVDKLNTWDKYYKLILHISQGWTE